MDSFRYMLRHATSCLCAVLLLSSIGCRALPTPTPRPTLQSTDTPVPTPTPWPTSQATNTPEPPDTGWRTLRAGVEHRQLRVQVGEVIERLDIIRLVPSSVTFRVVYDPLSPRTVVGWSESLDVTPLLVVNGGYFTPENETIGLVISDGIAWGTPYGDFAGLFAVGQDGSTSIRWLQDNPYDSTEPLAQGIQSFPVLVKPGGFMGFPADADDGISARRTVIAQDTQGRILLVVASRGYLSLHDMARFLTSMDLGVDVALNLDGGTSTGLWLRSETVTLTIDSLVPVPSALVVW